MADPRQSTRRDFLKGRAAADGLLDLTQGPDSPPADDESSTAAAKEAYLIHLGRRAMACQFELYFNAGQHAQATEAGIQALDLIDKLEDQLSVYRDHSEVSALNRTAAMRPVEVEPGLFGLLERSLDLADATGGAFDITSGPLSRAWGFLKRAGRKPTDEELAAARAVVGWQHVQLDPANKTVQFLQHGVEVNFNSNGKGYSLDRAADLLRAAGARDFLFHGGQSSVYAAGAHAASPERGWSVGLRHPMRPDRRIAEFYLQDRALGTSGAGTQFFHLEGKRYGHILDPRSGEPASGVYSATVIADSAETADALATAFYVLGADATANYLDQHADLAAMLVLPTARAGGIEIAAFGLSGAMWSRVE